MSTRKIYTTQELQDLLLPVFRGYPIHRAYLFGSYSRGEATKGSDVDIAVEPASNFRPLDVCGILDEAMDVLHKEVDVYSLGEFTPDSQVLGEIMRDRVLIYDGQS